MAVSDPLACPDPGVTVASPMLQAQQRIAAFVVVSLPLAGLLAALWLAVETGIGPVEIGLFLLFHALTTIGVTVGFHRHFAHRAFEAKPWVRLMLGRLGSMAAQGPLAFWMATHRRHHAYADAHCDPHSPHLHGDRFWDRVRGQWHAHINWLFVSARTKTGRFAKDALRDPVIVAVNREYPFWVLLGLILPTLLGGVLTLTWMGALKGFLWGGLVRMFAVHHAFWAIGGVAHSVGWRAFDTHDGSTNNFWLALTNGGEGWHNNHHAFPRSAYFGLAPLQIDFGAWAVAILKALGLVWNVHRPTPEMIEAKRMKAAAAVSQ